ncbi:MAG TPA: triose-phosphate isomerase [Acidimicrobiales bacterium]|nr:triose-phosphate isomerase [Acidimicrobiales bacterium]
MADRKPLISGNWKMNHTHLDAINVVQKLAYALSPADYERVEVSVHPAFTALRSVQTLLDADNIPIALGAQDVHPEDSGAFTGEVSPPMLAKLDVAYVIVGHSERRAFFGDTDEFVNQKLLAVLRHGMCPILCVGETLEEREAGVTEGKVLGQLAAGLRGVSAEAMVKVVIAYEPIWAIGTGRNASPEDAQAMCKAVRSAVGGRFGTAVAGKVRVQYGGSVTPGNAAELLCQADIDGALVGGASLDAERFAQIIRSDQAAPRRAGARY